MDPFSYLSVLISIILALGMTRVLAGVGEMLEARSHRRFYWVHMLNPQPCVHTPLPSRKRHATLRTASGRF